METIISHREISSLFRPQSSLPRSRATVPSLSRSFSARPAGVRQGTLKCSRRWCCSCSSLLPVVPTTRFAPSRASARVEKLLDICRMSRAWEAMAQP